MQYQQIFNRIIEMERASARNPNLMQTYKVMWEGLKEEIQFDKINSETSHNSSFIQDLPLCQRCWKIGQVQKDCPHCKGTGHCSPK